MSRLDAPLLVLNLNRLNNRCMSICEISRTIIIFRDVQRDRSGISDELSLHGSRVGLEPDAVAIGKRRIAPNNTEDHLDRHHVF